jgi:hypothetical protein
MSDSEFKSFNDPALRAAVRRVWSDERAPQELRQRMMALCPTQSGPGKARGNRGRSYEPVSMRIRSTLYGLAAAAIFLLAVGIAVADWNLGGRGPLRAPRVVALPTALSNDLYARHDADAKAAEHQLIGVSQTDFKAMGKQLQQRLNFPVLAANLPGKGWKFHGASVCKVGKTVTAHLLFDLYGKEYVSIFSMPVTEVADSGRACDYSEISTRHVMAGFTTEVGFYCVVVTSVDNSITLEEVRTLRDELKPYLADVPPNPGGPLATILAH